MTINDDTAICPITEEESASLPRVNLHIEAKGLDQNGNTIFWDDYKVNVMYRRDRIITLSQVDNSGIGGNEP